MRKLTKDEVRAMPPERLVFIDCESKRWHRTAALLSAFATEDARYVVMDDGNFAASKETMWYRDYENGPNSWSAFVYENEFTVDTPHGTILVSDKCDPDYPGVTVELVRPGKGNVLLAMAEYIPTYSEVDCAYNLSEPDAMRRQAEEIPDERRVGSEISEGFVTRAWPDENAEDDHCRVFHFGYEDVKGENVKL